MQSNRRRGCQDFPEESDEQPEADGGSAVYRLFGGSHMELARVVQLALLIRSHLRAESSMVRCPPHCSTGFGG